MKTSRFKIFVLLVGLLLSGCASKAPVFTAFPIPKDPALIHGSLPNGFQYVLMQNQKPENRVSMHLNIFAGSVHESDDQQGVAHYLEHMLFNGSEHFKPGQLIEYFQKIGMDFGADANARTGFFHTVYDLDLPMGDKPHLEDGLLVIKDYAEGALLLEEEVNRERGIILAEKRERDSVSYRTFKKELAFELPGSILNTRHPIGIKPVLEHADRNLLKSFYDKWYRPDNMVLVVVGDVNPDETIALIKDRLSGLMPRTSLSTRQAYREEYDIAWSPHKGIKAFYHHEPEAGNTDITIERMVHKDFKPQTPEDLKKEVSKTIGDKILENRLVSMIRKQTAHFSSASVYSGDFLRHISGAGIHAECKPEKWESSLAQLEKALRQCLVFGFKKEELERVKADVVSSMDAAVKQAGTRETSDLARSILGAVNQKKLFLSPLQEQALLKPYVQGLTLGDVDQAFRESWEDDHRLVLVTGNAGLEETGPDIEMPENKILNAYLQSTRVAINDFKGSGFEKFPYLSMPGLEDARKKARIMKQQDNINGLGITTVDYVNNVRLNMKETGFEKGQFRFKLTFGPGKKSQPVSKPGLALIGESTLRKSGFGAMDMDQLEQALAGRDVSFKFRVEDEYFSIEGSADPQEAELVFQLLYTYLKDPGFRPQGLGLAKIRYRQMYDNLKLKTDGIMQIKGHRFLAEEDPRFGLPSPDQVDQLSLEEIKAWLKPFFDFSPVELSIVGDFESHRMIQYTSAYLGALDARKEFASVNDALPAPVGFPKGKTLVLKLDTRIDKGVVRAAFLTDDFWDIRQTRRLSVLARIFSERLRKEVREQLGASYSPYSYNRPSVIYENYGVMHVVAPVQPGAEDPVYNVIIKIAGDLSHKGIEKNELDLVLKPLLNHLKVIRQENSYWLNSVMAGSFRHPERFDWANSILVDYEAVNTDELNFLARKYLKVVDAARISILPENR